ncbi:MAG TPA: YraN family protein [Actinomycetota bacterium]|nr:YraN family protein [Actinomycetota bacterium]
MTGRQQVQLLGEDSAAGLLEKKGMTILARNWRCKLGELDLVARDGPTLVFVEVKCRSSARIYDPGLAVDGRKQLRLRRVAQAFLAAERPRYLQCRFDVVSVVAGTQARINHIVDAF